MSESQSIQIRGGNYASTENADGTFTVHNFPIMSEVKKGTKGAPKDYGRDELQKLVDNATERYFKYNFCATAFYRHNGDTKEPKMMGFVLPKRVAKYKFPEGDKWTIFGDVKLNKAAFEAVKAGLYPYHSPEVPWEKERISGLAFLDTEPPYFEYELFTVAEAKPDLVGSTAAFKADPESIGGSFMEDEKKKDEKEMKAQDEEKDEKKDEKKMKAQEDEKDEKKDEKKGDMKCGKKGKMESDPADTKSDGKPYDKEDKNMQADPKEAAKFAALEDKVAALEAKEEARKAEAEAKARETAAFEALKSHEIGEKAKAGIAKFAAIGDDELNEYVEVLKESTPVKLPGDMAEFEAGLAKVNADDPDVAKFSSPDEQAEAARFAAEYDEIMKISKGNYSVPREVHIKNRMAEEKANN